MGDHPLPTAALGRTGLAVTRLGYGAMEIRGPRVWGGRPLSDEQASSILEAAADAGVNFIDTANDYGRSEEFIGRFLSHRRDRLILATKCGCHVTRRDEHTDDTPHVWTRDNLFRGLHESLTRLRTDYVDVMQLHNPTPEQVRRGELLEALRDMRGQGKVRWLGVSTTMPHVSEFLASGAFDVFQIPYSALERKHEQWVTRVGEAGAGVIVRGGVARGAPGAGLGNADRWKAFDQARLDELLAPGESRTAFLLRFTLSHPHAHTVIVGTLRPEHLIENAEAARRGKLPADVYAEAKRRLGSAGVTAQAVA